MIPIPSSPNEQLHIVHDELNRQRGSVAAQHSSTLTQASILIGGAGVGISLISTRLHSPFVWVSGFLALMAAVLGIYGLLARAIGVKVSARALRTAALQSGITAYDVELRLIDDKVASLEFEQNALVLKRRAVLLGFVALVLSWSSIVSAAS